MITSVTLLALIALVSILIFLRFRGKKQADWLRAQLVAPSHEAPLRFNPAMIETLPKPVQNYLGKAIASQAPLAHCVVLAMQGQIRLKPEGKWYDFTAKESLRDRFGFLWEARVGKGLLPLFGGFDSFGPTAVSPVGVGTVRFWLLNLLPLVHQQGQRIDQSSIGRLLMEHIWLPSALLPTQEIEWEAIDENHIRYTLRVASEPLTVEIGLDAQHRPVWVKAQRVRGEDGRLESFGGTFSDFGGFDGYYIPTALELGWGYGTENYRPFFKATIRSARFLTSSAAT